MKNDIFKILQDKHVAAWNEKDAEKRNSLLREIYADDITMYDSEAIFDGLQAISDFIGKLLLEDPVFRFAAVSPIEALHNGARLYGQIRTSGGMLDSMDFFLVEEGKVKRLYAFLQPANQVMARS